jgi:hypothetical protein
MRYNELYDLALDITADPRDAQLLFDTMASTEDW